MRLALEQAQLAGSAGDVPVGAVVLDAAGQVIGAGGNQREQHADPTAHAEIVALGQAAARLGQWRLHGCTLVVTLEPCTMCAGAIVLAQVDRLVFGAFDAKEGAVGSLYDVVRDPRHNVNPQVYAGVLGQQCGQMLRDFFAARRSEGAIQPQ